ncbi:MAG: transposase [Nanoarchaeota archaeon]
MTDLEDNSSLKAYLGFKKLPHYTTLIKFSLSLPPKILEKLLIAFAKLIPTPKRVVIDSTGISLDNASTHYCKRIGLSYKKRPFLKTSLVFDIDNYFILLCKTGKSKRHDTKDAKPLIKKLAKIYDDIEIFYGDRAYDDEKIFKIVFEILGAYPLILQRRIDIPTHRRRGTYRKKTFKEFDYCEYLQRNKGETGNSMLKKRFAPNIKSRITKIQKRDLFSRIIAYNIDRLLRIGKEAILILLKIIRISY